MDRRPAYREFILYLAHGWGRDMSGPPQVWLTIGVTAILLIVGGLSIHSESTFGLITTGFVAIGALHLTCYRLWSQERNKVVDLQVEATPNISISFESKEPWFIK